MKDDLDAVCSDIDPTYYPDVFHVERKKWDSRSLTKSLHCAVPMDSEGTEASCYAGCLGTTGDSAWNPPHRYTCVREPDPATGRLCNLVDLVEVTL